MTTSLNSATPETVSDYRQYLLDRKDTLEFELNRVLVEYNENFHYPDPLFDASFNGAKKFLHTQLEVNRLRIMVLDMREAA